MEEKVYTYLLKSKGEYKIGKSVDPEKRLRQLQTGNTDVRLIAYGEGMTEKALHNKFAERRTKGEWFKLKVGDVETIIRLLKNDYQIKEDSGNYDKKLAYVINFGMFKGRIISTMTSTRELSYMSWFIQNTGNKKSKIAKIFRWWLLEMGYNIKPSYVKGKNVKKVN